MLPLFGQLRKGLLLCGKVLKLLVELPGLFRVQLASFCAEDAVLPLQFFKLILVAGNLLEQQLLGDALTGRWGKIRQLGIGKQRFQCGALLLGAVFQSFGLCIQLPGDGVEKLGGKEFAENFLFFFVFTCVFMQSAV